MQDVGSCIPNVVEFVKFAMLLNANPMEKQAISGGAGHGRDEMRFFTKRDISRPFAWSRRHSHICILNDHAKPLRLEQI